MPWLLWLGDSAWHEAQAAKRRRSAVTFDATEFTIPGLKLTARELMCWLLKEPQLNIRTSTKIGNSECCAERGHSYQVVHGCILMILMTPSDRLQQIHPLIPRVPRPYKKQLST
eukprot:4637127-Amphidinium_carterae.2